MTLHCMTREELRRVYETDLIEAFPPSELKPLSAMENLLEKGLYDPLCLKNDEGEALGYVLLWRHEDGRYFLIDYLCVPARMRNAGIGAKILAAMKAYYPEDAVFFGESEAPTGDPARDEMILRRLGFYQRCGAKTLSYECALFGVRFKCLAFAEPMPDERELLRKHQEVYRAQFTPERYAQAVQLPLAPGEEPFAVTDWVED